MWCIDNNILNYFYLLLYFSSKTFIDFIPNLNNTNNLNNTTNNQKINENNNLNYNELNKQLINEKIKNKELNEKIIKLQKDLDNERNLVKKLENKIKNYNELQNLINLKNNEIEELKSNPNEIKFIKPGERIYSINFISVDQKIINYSIACKNTDVFVRLEEKLYEDYPEYKDKETYFMKSGDKIKRFKKLDENKIKNNDVIMLYIYDI